MSTINREDAVRLFGMSGLQIQDELRKVEKQIATSVRSKSSTATTVAVPEHDTEYYPQFDKKVRDEAAAMARHYEVFYCLEQTIRDLVAGRMLEVHGADWWNTKVPQGVKDEAKKNQDRERDLALTVRSDDPLDYTTFGQLGEVITGNWDVFSDTFTSQKAVTRVMAQLNALRGPIAHCCPMSEDEIARLRLSVKDWFRLME